MRPVASPPVFVALAVALSAVACSEATPPVAPSPLAAPDVALTCASSARTDAAFDVDPAGPDGQIHAYAVRAGEGMFVVYNRPSASGKGNFEVYVTRLSCAGDVLVPPTKVSDSADNEIDPAAAWDGQRLLVVWSADTGKAPANLELRARALGLDGKAEGPVRTLSLSRAGRPHSGNVWMPALGAGQAGPWLAGAWGHDAAPAFQVFAQRLDASGAPSGEAMDLALNAAVTQSAPSVAVDASGRRWVAWAEEPNAGAAAPSAWVAAEGSRGEEVIAGGGAPSLASGASGTWLAARGAVLELGARQRATLPANLSQPALAVDAAGAVVVAYTGAAGRVPLAVVRVTSGGAVSAPAELGVADAAPYPLHLEPVADGLFLLAFQVGAGSKIRAKARLLRVE
ncbi:MAG: hypothetical protein IPF92_21795 [Myxococcales bacterium]|nr:hypothetical protein [Myxococcales bacterium]HQY65081.1 hypothetical protein [Polyangiaceae bacterium]